MLVDMTKPIPPAPTIPSMAHSEKFISNLIPVHEIIWDIEAGSTALENTASLPAPVASMASSVSFGMFSKLSENDLVKNDAR